MGPQAHDYLRQLEGDVQVVALAETHVTEEAIPRWRGKLQADGWKLAATPSVSMGRSLRGSHGGEWVLARSSVAATTRRVINERRILRQDEVVMFAVHVARQGAAPGAGGRNARELGGAGVQTPFTVGVWDLQGVIGRSEGVQASRWRGSGSLGTRSSAGR